MAWEIKKITNIPKLKNPILIAGLPGIGNVGKIACDFMIDYLKAKKCYTFFSYTFPHSVFVNEENLVELPSISLYYKKSSNPKSKDLLFLSGDIQPIDEKSSYEFSDTALNLVKQLGCNEVVTVGGIGLQEIPKVPKVYCTGNNKKIVEKYLKGTKMQKNLYGHVGLIVGVAGLLVGLSDRKKINAVSILAETFAHPVYLGVAGTREILKVLEKKLNIKLNLKKLDEEISNVEENITKKTENLINVSKQSAIKKLKKTIGEDHTNYIG